MKRCKRVVIDGVIFGLQKAGGISRVWAETLLGLDASFAKEAHVTLLVPTNTNVEWEKIAPALKNIQVVKRRRFRWKKRGFFRESLYLAMVALRFRPHVWHSSYYVGFPRFFSGRKVITFHDMIPEVLGTATPYDTAMKYLTVKESDAIVAVSNHSKRDLERIWPDCRGKTHVIHNCTTTHPQSDQPADTSPYFLYMGKRGEYKNFVPALREILKDPRFHDYKIKVVGGEEGWSREEGALMRRLKADARIERLGILPFEKVGQLTASASALLFPSIYEGFGFPVLEAFEHGVPVLACRTSSIPEITGDAYPLADPNDPKSLTETLSQLLKERPKWVDYGHQRTAQFSREKMTQSLCNLYHEIFDRHNHL